MSASPRWSATHERQARDVCAGAIDATPAQVRALLWGALCELDRCRGTVAERQAARQRRLL